MTTVTVEVLGAGWCTSLAALAQSGEPWRRRRFPAGVTLIRHPRRGLVLFDTGYSRASVRALNRWPAWAYGRLLPVTLPPGEALVDQLTRRGEVDEVRAIICSHLHIDHIGGAVDFPDVPVWLDQNEIDALTTRSGISAVRHGVVPGIVPEHDRLTPFAYHPAPEWLAPFEFACDFFEDDSIWIVPSPGHTDGSVSAVARTADGLVLLAGDVAWSERALREGLEPHPAVREIANHDFTQARRTAVHWRTWLARHPDARVVVSHDAATA